MYEVEMELAEYLRKILEDFDIIDKNKLILDLKDIKMVLKVIKEISLSEGKNISEIEIIKEEINICNDSKLKTGTKIIYLMNHIGDLLLDESQDSKVFSRTFVMPREMFMKKVNEFSNHDVTNKIYKLEESFQVELNDVVGRTKDLKLMNF